MLFTKIGSLYSVIKKQSYDYELIAMAYHESGHAVCALHNFMKVYNVNVMTPKNQEGNTDCILYDDNYTDDEELVKVFLIFELQMTYAGLLAEKMYYKDICGSDKFPMHLKQGSSDDIKSASKLIRRHRPVSPGRSTYLFKNQIQNDVEQLLTEHWDAVKIVAHALYQKKRLSYDELKYLLTRRTERKDFWKDKFKKINFIHNEKREPTLTELKDIMLDDVIFSI
jgi:ATP-dependent Zn protease